MNQIYLIESGIMLDAAKKYIDEMRKCRIEYSKFAEGKGATRYFCNRSRLYGLETNKQIENWTKPRRRSGESRPKKGCPDYDLIKSLPTMPNEIEIIRNITGVPTSISYKSGTGSGHSSIGSPLSECGFLYVSKHDLYAFWTPDLKEALSRYSGCGITNGADTWSMSIDGVKPISRNKWDLLVAQCNVSDEES